MGQEPIRAFGTDPDGSGTDAGFRFQAPFRSPDPFPLATRFCSPDDMAMRNPSPLAAQGQRIKTEKHTVAESRE
jgi:hypothetical protein